MGKELPPLAPPIGMSVTRSMENLGCLSWFLLTSVAATTATATTTSTVATTAEAAATAATTVASHLGQPGVDLLLGLLKHIYEFTSLLGVWKYELARTITW